MYSTCFGEKAIIVAPLPLRAVSTEELALVDRIGLRRHNKSKMEEEIGCVAPVDGKELRLTGLIAKGNNEVGIARVKAYVDERLLSPDFPGQEAHNRVFGDIAREGCDVVCLAERAHLVGAFGNLNEQNTRRKDPWICSGPGDIHKKSFSLVGEACLVGEENPW